jgi:SMODS and SLOG-associating 2TM effector domain 3/SMODS and SLOG-associating 2TM effector domain 1
MDRPVNDVESTRRRAMTDIHDRPTPDETAPVLDEPHLPAIYLAADAQATAAQRRFMRLIKGQIAFPIAGVALSVLPVVITSFDLTVLGVVASAAVAGAVTLRIVQQTSHVETVWYRARSCAETIRSLAWRYAVCALPFGPELAPDACDALFIDRLRNVAVGFPDLAAPAAGEEITPRMRELRESPQPVRTEAYMHGRLIDQHDWYRGRALNAARAANRWDALFYVLALSAVIAGFALVRYNYAAPVISIAGAGVGAIVAWTGVRRYSSAAHSYARVATDLSFAESLIRHDETTRAWAEFVARIEDTIAHEQMHWIAARL